MQLPEVYCNLHSSLKLVNCIVFSRLHLLRRRGTYSKVASWQQPVYWSPDLRSWWQHWSRTRIFSTETGCRGIVPSSAASDAFTSKSVHDLTSKRSTGPTILGVFHIWFRSQRSSLKRNANVLCGQDSFGDITRIKSAQVNAASCCRRRRQLGALPNGATSRKTLTFEDCEKSWAVCSDLQLLCRAQVLGDILCR